MVKKVKVHKTGALHRMLNEPEGTKIPTTLLREFLAKPMGNHVMHNGKRIAITRLLKQRMAFALSWR